MRALIIIIFCLASVVSLLLIARSYWIFDGYYGAWRRYRVFSGLRQGQAIMLFVSDKPSAPRSFKFTYRDDLKTNLSIQRRTSSSFQFDCRKSLTPLGEET